jgi:hypothetical protein
MPGKLGVNIDIKKSKVEQCSNQTNQVVCTIMVLQRKFDISIEKVATLEKNVTERKVKINKSKNESHKKKRARDNDMKGREKDQDD